MVSTKDIVLQSGEYQGHSIVQSGEYQGQCQVYITEW